MKKIYNNLSIENLIKTDCFNQFNYFQQKEIKQGLQDNLDVLIYAKPEYSDSKMMQIRIGLLKKLDISIYAKKKI